MGIIRSFVYGNPKCREGTNPVSELAGYIKNHLQFATLNNYDLKMMPYMFYYQINVCDSYGQYFGSDADNRNIYLFENHAKALSETLLGLA